MDMKKIRYVKFAGALLFGWVCLLCAGATPLNGRATQETGSEKLHQMLAAMRQIKTLNIRVNKWERINGKRAYGAFRVRQQVSPYRLYFYQLDANKTHGTQALYDVAAFGHKLVIKMGNFPYLTLNLSPHGSLVLKESHHSILHIGYRFFGQVVENLLKRKSAQIDQIAHYKGVWKYKTKPCHKVELNINDYRYVTHIVKANEKNLEEVADPLGVSAHRILELNPELDDFEDIKTGQALKIPTEYATKIELYLDKDNYLPLALIADDPVGFFEQFEFDEVTLNPVYSADEFTKAKYKF